MRSVEAGVTLGDYLELLEDGVTHEEIMEVSADPDKFLAEFIDLYGVHPTERELELYYLASGLKATRIPAPPPGGPPF
jgi:hypothetical protein